MLFRSGQAEDLIKYQSFMFENPIVWILSAIIIIVAGWFILFKTPSTGFFAFIEENGREQEEKEKKRLQDIEDYFQGKWL